MGGGGEGWPYECVGQTETEQGIANVARASEMKHPNAIHACTPIKHFGVLNSHRMINE